MHVEKINTNYYILCLNQAQVKFSIPLIDVSFSSFPRRQLDITYHISPDILIKEQTINYEVVLGKTITKHEPD